MEDSWVHRLYKTNTDWFGARKGINGFFINVNRNLVFRAAVNVNGIASGFSCCDVVSKFLTCQLTSFSFNKKITGNK